MKLHRRYCLILLISCAVIIIGLLNDKWGKSYEVISQNYSQNDKLVIAYPALSGLPNEVIQEKINSILLDNALYFVDEQVESTMEISYEIKRCDRILSIVYCGYLNFNSAPHPNNYFYTVNIDVLTGEVVNPNTLFTPTKNELLQVLEANFVYPDTPQNAESVKKFLESEIVNNLWNQTDMDKPNSVINLYLTMDTLGVRFNVPYALGSYAIIEIPHG